MALDLMNERGTPLDRQQFNWQDLVRTPISKLNDDAFTRVRVILMNGIEAEALRFGHSAARINGPLREALARVRRVEHFQQTLVNWLNPPDQNPLETTLGFEQNAIEVTAAIAKAEPDPYIAQVLRFGLLEDFDHLYRYSALYDRVEGKDPNCLIQNYTDIRPGRPTSWEHRYPLDDLRKPYDARTADPLTKFHTLTIVAGEHMTHNYYMIVGPTYADPVGRQLYAEIAAIEEQHVTQYECMMDPSESLMEKWLLHEANEVYNYYSCAAFESNKQIKEIWQRFTDYELGQLHFVMELFKQVEGRDPAEILPATLPEPIQYKEHRDYVRKVLAEELYLEAQGTDFIDRRELPKDYRSQQYRDQLNSEGSPSETVSAGYVWTPGTELVKKAQEVGVQPGRVH